MKNKFFIMIVYFVLNGCGSIPKTGPKQDPSIGIDQLILHHKYFTINYNKNHRLANWVKYTLTKVDLNGPGVRPKKFKPDPLLKEKGIQAVTHDEYTNSGYARGHLAPAEDFSRSQEAMESTFIMSNVMPQKSSINSGSWSQLEKQVRKWACGEEKITVITGPILNPNLPVLRNSDISIPREFYKIIIDETPPKKSIAFLYNQESRGQNTINNQVSITSLVPFGINYDEIPQDSKIEDWEACPY